MLALEVSSAAGRKSYGGIPGTIRSLVGALLRIDPEDRYALCYRFSRWRRGGLFRPPAPNAQIRVLQDPWNAVLIRGARLLHSMGIFLPRTPRIPKLLTVHDLNAVRNTQWVSPRWHERRSARIRKALSRADHVVTYSRFTADEVCEEYALPADRVHPLLLGVDSERFNPAPAGAVDEMRHRYGDFVLSIGILTARKNFARLAAAVAPIPSMRLVIVGGRGDAEQQLRETARSARLADRFTLLETVTHEELVALLTACRVYAVPSLYEGFGLTVLEAMACGSPVVCSKAASLPEVAGDAALMVDATDVEALTDALKRCIEDEALAVDLRQRGLTRAHEFCWDRSAHQLRQLYREVSGA